MNLKKSIFRFSLAFTLLVYVSIPMVYFIVGVGGTKSKLFDLYYAIFIKLPTEVYELINPIIDFSLLGSVLMAVYWFIIGAVLSLLYFGIKNIKKN